MDSNRYEVYEKLNDFIIDKILLLKKKGFREIKRDIGKSLEKRVVYLCGGDKWFKSYECDMGGN